MLRKTVLLSLCLLLVSGLALADKGETKIATGNVKAITPDSLTIQQGTVEFSFVVGEDTKVIAKGASTKTRQARKEKKPLTITDFIQKDYRVMVRYREDENGKLHAVEVRRLS